MRICDLPSALDPALIAELATTPPVVLADYDGTLTPIVARPEMAVLDASMLDALVDLSGLCTLGIISGRDLDDVRSMVDAPGLWLAGSHGFDVLSPTGERRELGQGEALLPALDAAQSLLAQRVGAVPGAWVERKRFAIAIHYRQSPEDQVDALRSMVDEVSRSVVGLRVAGGKKIFELRPDIAWDKGAALDWVVEAAGEAAGVAGRVGAKIVYLGDDETDEDAFERLAVGPQARNRGFGIVVGTEDRPTSATHRLDDPDAVREFLVMLASALRQDRS